MFLKKKEKPDNAVPVDETAEERERAKEKLRDQRARVQQLEQQADILRRQHDPS